MGDEVTDSRRKYVRARTWDVVANPDFFPERDDPEIGIAELLDKVDLGVCLSGGGTRSASASLGQLRGLREIGLLDKIRYICAVSGGSWTATPFTYLPDSIDDETFLGPRIEPGQINDDDLKYAPDGSMAKAIENSVIADDVIESWFSLRGDESYARAVGDIFLDPFSLDDNDKFFTWNRKSRTAVLNNNSKDNDSDHYLKPEDFYLAREGRPYLIVGATLLYGPRDNHVVVPMEITPLYLGMRQHVQGQGKNGGDIGGCYIESFAYDSKFNQKDIGTCPFRVKFWSRSTLPGGKRYFFTLSDMIGNSGAAPAEKLYERGVTKVGFPEFRHWSIHSLEKEHAEYEHGDGGHADNLGVMPMLARGVKNIIVFVNSPTPFQLGRSEKRYDKRLAPLFGFTGTPVVDNLSGTERSSENHVFESDKFTDLLEGLQRCQDEQKTLIFMDSYDVRENSRYGIRSYSGVKIVWIYNADVPLWRAQLPAHVRADLRNLEKHSDFERFPNYRTFGERNGKIIDLSKAQVNALAHLSCWNVTENAASIKIQFGL